MKGQDLVTTENKKMYRQMYRHREFYVQGFLYFPNKLVNQSVKDSFENNSKGKLQGYFSIYSSSGRFPKNLIALVISWMN
jgi:hypothetical protein